MNTKLIALAGCVALAVPAAANAQDRQEGSAPIVLSGEVGIVSDYRFRGVSLSDGKYAVQGSVTVSARSGFYASAWASNIADYAGAQTEIDLTAGWSGPIGPLTADVSAIGYVYPNGESVNYYEFAGSLSKKLGPIGAKIGAAYSPNQKNIGGTDNTYVYGEASYALVGTPVTLNAKAGYENGVYKAKKDYAVGASLDLAMFTLGLNYIKVKSDPLDELGALAADKAVISLKGKF